MKVVHINTYDTGGAANAAIEIHTALLKQGVNSSFLSLYKNTDTIENSYVFPRINLPVRFKILRKLKLYKTHSERNQQILSKAKGDFDAFSFPESDFNILEHETVKNADIIHLHWVGNFLDYPSFFKHNKKETVWTLHDKNPAMGGFHLYNDKYRSNNLKSTEEQLVSIKTKALKYHKTILIVSPSEQLRQFSQKSMVLGRFSHYQIYNCINTSVFKPYDKLLAKQIFNIPTNKVHILCLWFDDKVYHKGFNLMLNILEKFKGLQVFFTFISNEQVKESTTEFFRVINKINDKPFLALQYSSADAFLITSCEENLPNTMLEAMACGTPVIAFPVGGMLDVIKPGFNGLLATEISAVALHKAINEFIETAHNYSSEAIRAFAEQHFAPEVVAKQYISLYHQILAK